MNNIENHIDELIGKYLADEATPQEVATVESWAAQSEVNRKYIDQFRVIFTKAATVKELQHFDTDSAWQKVKANLKNRESKTVQLKPSADSKFFWKIAASIAVVLGIGFFIYKLLSPVTHTIEPIEVVAEKQVVTDTLPDGSEVVLNKETKITYAYNKKEKKHEVKLRGEAYFSVKRESSEQFIIDADGIFIRDIGTSFNVKAYPEANTVEVVVEEGEVIFYTEENPGIRLHASGKGVYDKKTKTFSIEQPESNVLAYKTKFFIFSGTDLKTVAETLNDVYDKKIVVAESLHACQLSVSFNNETLEEIAEVIAETLNLTLKKSANTILLEGDGCE